MDENYTTWKTSSMYIFLNGKITIIYYCNVVIFPLTCKVDTLRKLSLVV